MLTINTPAEAERFVARQQRLGNDVRWENYDMVFFRESEKGRTNKDGAFRNGVWGFDNRSPLLSDGTWAVDYRNVKKAKRNRE